MADFHKLGAEVVGISPDDIKVLAAFQSQSRAPQRFVSDPDKSIAKAYGAVIGVGKMALDKRMTFVIARDGTVRYSVFDWSPLTNVSKVHEWLKEHPQT